MAPSRTKPRSKPSVGPWATTFAAGSALGCFIGLVLALSVRENPLVASVTSSVMALAVTYATIRGFSSRGGPAAESDASENGSSTEGEGAAADKAKASSAPGGEAANATTGSSGQALLAHEDAQVRASGAAIGFGLFACIGLLGGVYIRTHDLLSPTPEELTKRWTAAGFTESEAQELVAVGLGYKLRHPDPPKREADAGPAAHEEPPAQDSSADAAPPFATKEAASATPPGDQRPSRTVESYSDTVRVNDTVLLNDDVKACAALRVMKFVSAKDGLDVFRTLGEPWKSKANAIEKAPEGERVGQLNDYVRKRCKL